MTVTTTTTTARQRLQEAEGQLQDLQTQMEQTRNLYASAASTADGDTMARARLEFIALQEKATGMELRLQQCLVDDAVEQKQDWKRRQMEAQEHLRELAPPLQKLAEAYSRAQQEYDAVRAQGEEAERQQQVLQGTFENLQRELMLNQEQARRTALGWS